MVTSVGRASVNDVSQTTMLQKRSMSVKGAPTSLSMSCMYHMGIFHKQGALRLDLNMYYDP